MALLRLLAAVVLPVVALCHKLSLAEQLDVFGSKQPEYSEGNDMMQLPTDLYEAQRRTLPVRPWNASCPQYFTCNTMSNGLGDHLERLIYCMHAAKLLGFNASDMVVRSFDRAPAKHSGSAEYEEVAAFLGVQTELARNRTLKSLRRQHGSLAVYQLTLYQVYATHARLLTGWQLPCASVYSSEINSCLGWCTRKTDYSALRDTEWLLRGGRPRDKCRARGLGFPADAPGVQLVWHVRNGDICLKCRASYYVNLLKALQETLGDRQLAVTFESQQEISFPTPPQLADVLEFSGAAFHVNQSLLSSVCTFLTADVLLTTGSSLPVFLATFADPWAPILFEERMKGGRRRVTHYRGREEAVLLDEGRVVSHSPDELRNLFNSVLPRGHEA
jgi:hypothetical protein